MTNNRFNRLGLLTLLTVLAGTPGTTLAQATGSIATPDDAIVREGTGERREMLDEMERAQFPRDAWSKLSKWSGSAGGLPEGTVLNGSNTAGKVVVFYTWASYYPTSMQPLYQLGRLQQRYGDQGLVIVGVHHPEGFEDAPAKIKQRRAEIISAHDADGAFREAVNSDQDPDFYIVDRAGQLRFADVSTKSLEAAVTLLLAEEADDAASLNDRLAAERERRERELRRLTGIRQKIDVSDLPRVPFIEPDSEMYTAVDWPEIRTDGRTRSRDVFTPAKTTLPDEGWTPSKPEPHGQGMVIWFWDPLDTSTFDTEMQWAEELQLANQRDLVVVGVAVSSDAQERRRRNDDDTETERRQQERQEVYEEMLTGRTLKQMWLADWQGPFVDDALSGADLGQRRGSVNEILPFVVSVVSSDGYVRWVGSKLDQRLEMALETLLREDPGIVSRRTAEDAFIRQREREQGTDTGADLGAEMDTEDSDG